MRTITSSLATILVMVAIFTSTVARSGSTTGLAAVSLERSTLLWYWFLLHAAQG